MKNGLRKAADEIMVAAQLAAALEVSGWPKPGNIHRTSDFHDTRYEHFIASSIGFGPTVREAALRGMRVALQELQPSQLGLGGLIREAVEEAKRWHRGGNTHLGTILLFTPLVTAAGMTYIESERRIEADPLRKSVVEVMEATQPQDALEVYEAILSSGAGGLGRLKEDTPDLGDRGGWGRIMEEGITLYQLMEMASAWDGIAREWVTGMRVTFELGYPTFKGVLEETGDVNIATVHTYLTILSKNPDTFIARKVGLAHSEDIRGAVKIGLEVAEEISRRAGRVLGLGGLLEEEGRRELIRFDEDLRRSGKELNPGTTADLTASSILVALLCGSRP